MTNHEVRYFVRDLDPTNENERGLPCFVHHEDAGGRCDRLAAMQVYGLHFCEAHGEDVRLGALSQATHEAYCFFEQFRNPEGAELGFMVERGLRVALDQVTEARPSGEEEERAMRRAFPDAPAHVREYVEVWERDEEPGRHPVYDSLRDTLNTVHRAMQVAHADGETWLVEILELERESLAAQAAYASRERCEARPVG